MPRHSHLSPFGLFTVLVSLLATAQAFAATDVSACSDVLQPYQAAYSSEVKGIAMTGRRVLKEVAPDQFELSHGAKTLGARITERSVFKREENALRMREYQYDRSIFGIKRNEGVVFDATRRLVFSRDRELPWSDDYVDGLSYQLALRCDLAQGKKTVTYPVVRRGKVKQYTFTRVGNAVIETRLGPLETVIVDRERDDDERSTRIWFASGLNHMLVKLVQVEKDEGLSITLAIESLTFEDRSLEAEK